MNMNKEIYLPLEWFYGAGRVVLTKEWVSNGHISVRRELVVNDYNFESAKAIAKWDPYLDDDPVSLAYQEDSSEMYAGIFSVLKDKDKVKEFGIHLERVPIISPDIANNVMASHVGNDGTTTAYFQRRYIDGLYLCPNDKLYGTTNITAFFDAPNKEDVSIIVMPVKPPPTKVVE